MTLGGAFRIGLVKWHWILGPALAASLLAALTAAVVQSAETYRVTRTLRTTEGAPAEAIFALRSRDVLVRAMELAELARPLPPEELVRNVEVRDAGGGRIHLTVERPSRREAESLANFITSEAARAVEVVSIQVRAESAEETRRIERDILQLRATLQDQRARLLQLRRDNPTEIDASGQPLGASQRRLAEIDHAIAQARQEGVKASAEAKALAERLAVTPEFIGFSSAPLEDASLAQLDRRIAELREDLTDEHPHLAALLAERAMLAGRSAPETRTPNPVRVELARAHASAEAMSAASAAVIDALEGERGLVHARFEEAATAERQARQIADNLARTTADLEEAERRLASIRTRASEDVRARAALVDVTGAEPSVLALRPDAPPARLTLLGAVFGLVIGILLAALAEAMDPGLRSPGDVERHLDMPVLMSVPMNGLQVHTPHARALTLGLAAWALSAVAAVSFTVFTVYPGWPRIRQALDDRRDATGEVFINQVEEVIE